MSSKIVNIALQIIGYAFIALPMAIILYKSGLPL